MRPAKQYYLRSATTYFDFQTLPLTPFQFAAFSWQYFFEIALFVAMKDKDVSQLSDPSVLPDLHGISNRCNGAAERTRLEAPGFKAGDDDDA